MEHSIFCCPQISLFGKGSISRLPELIQGKYKKALLVTDKSILEHKLHEGLLQELKKADIACVIFDGVKPNPTVDNVNLTAATFKENNCDLLISLGGGSAIDCAKAASIILANEGDLLDYLRDEKLAKAAVPHIAISTTAGTGSEATHSYVISDDKAHAKYGMRDRLTLPIIAVNDTDMVFSLPAGMTAATGMDALTHAVEAFIGPRQSYITQELALSAMKLIFAYLPKVCANLRDKEAREKMSVAQYLAGLAFGNTNVGLVHCMSHQLSAVYDTPHGIANAALLPECLRFEKKGCIDQLAEIAHTLWPIESQSLADETAADLTIEKIQKLSDTVGTALPLAQLGLKEEDIPLLAEKTLQDGSINNSAVFPTVQEVGEIFARAK